MQVNLDHNKPEGFDTRVHILDPRSGRVMKEQHYALHIVNGMQVYERAGEYFWPNGIKTTKEELLKLMPQFASNLDLDEESAGRLPVLDHTKKKSSKKVDKAHSASS